jgi:hypothetical protein
MGIVSQEDRVEDNNGERVGLILQPWRRAKAGVDDGMTSDGARYSLQKNLNTIYEL